MLKGTIRGRYRVRHKSDLARCRTTPAEKRLWEHAASGRGMTLSAWLRSIANDEVKRYARGKRKMSVEEILAERMSRGR